MNRVSVKNAEYLIPENARVLNPRERRVLNPRLLVEFMLFNSLIFCVVFCRSLFFFFFLLAVILSVLLLITVSDYRLGIFKHYLRSLSLCQLLLSLIYHISRNTTETTSRPILSALIYLRSSTSCPHLVYGYGENLDLNWRDSLHSSLLVKWCSNILFNLI